MLTSLMRAIYNVLNDAKFHKQKPYRLAAKKNKYDLQDFYSIPDLPTGVRRNFSRGVARYIFAL